MSSVENPRRYCLLKAQASSDSNQWGLSAAWLGKQELRPGTALPADFPSLSLLTTAHYTTSEDLAGADVAELTKRAALTRHQAEAVLRALADL